MPAAQFTQFGSSKLYLATAPDAPRPFGFLATSLSVAQVSLNDAWTLDPSGVFFNLPAPVTPANWPQIERALRNWLSNAGWPGTGQRHIWAELGTDGITPATVISLCVGQSSPAKLTQAVTLDFAGYLVDLVQAATLAPSSAGDMLLLSGASIFSREASPPASYPLVRGALGIAVNGPGAGSLLFALDLPNDGTGGQASDFDLLGIGIRYGWRKGDSGVDYYHAPTLIQPTGVTTLWAALAPFDSLTAPISRFSFVPAPPVPGTGAAAIVSSFITPEGRAVALAPAATGSSGRPGGLVFARQPLFWSASAPFTQYLTPDGDFTASALDVGTSTQPLQIVCGLGGMEYVIGAAPAALTFTPGTAFLPAPDAPTANTAWVLVGGANGSVYYAQPDAAPFYATPDANAFLGFAAIPTAVLPAAQAALPMLGYGGLENATAAAIAVEQSVVAVARAARIAAVPVAAPPSPLPAWGLTPQGLIAGFDQAQLGDWAWMGVANVKGTTQPDIVFNNVKAPFLPAMQNAAPFIVMVNPDIVMASASVAYLLTAAQITELQNAPPACFKTFKAWAALAVLGGQAFSSEWGFNNALAALDLDAVQLDLLQRMAGQMQAVIDDWVFKLAPRTWPPMQASQTSDGVAETRQGVMIIKMDRTTSLADWIDQLENSSWPAAAILPSGRLNDTADLLRDAVNVAETRRAAAADPALSPYAHFLDVVLIEPTWTGMLMLNAEVPLDTLPTDLRAIQAGIRPELFYAHHIGFEPGLVGISGGALSLNPNRIFGVIDYEDSDDLTLDPQSAADFQFKALQLTVGIERSHVAGFVGRVELFVNRLYGATARKYPTTSGNNLILDGIKILEAGDDGQLRVGYRFSGDGVSNYQLAGSALANVVVDETSLGCNTALSTADKIVSDFILSGGLLFQPTSGFDMFGYGPDAPPPAPPAQEREEKIEITPFGPARVISVIDRKAARDAKASEENADADADTGANTGDQDDSGSALAFERLVVRMTFTLSTNSTTFEALGTDAAFNLAASAARSNGLPGRFPAVPLRFVKGSASGQSPTDMGYAPVSCGVQQAIITSPWYGIEFQMELGTLGALAGGAGITITLLAAWGVDETTRTPPVFLGVSLPGMGAQGFELPLQGILKIGFGAIQFDTYDAGDGGLGYIMRLRDFGLHVLGQNFPSGHINVLITGDPQADGPSKLGWFAGYEEDKYKPTSRAAIRRRFAAPRKPQVGRS